MKITTTRITYPIHEDIMIIIIQAGLLMFGPDYMILGGMDGGLTDIIAVGGHITRGIIVIRIIMIPTIMAGIIPDITIIRSTITTIITQMERQNIEQIGILD